MSPETKPGLSSRTKSALRRARAASSGTVLPRTIFPIWLGDVVPASPDWYQLDGYNGKLLVRIVSKESGYELARTNISNETVGWWRDGITRENHINAVAAALRFREIVESLKALPRNSTWVAIHQLPATTDKPSQEVSI